MNKLFSVLRSRLTMNILFWLILIFVAFIINFYSGKRQLFYPLYWYNIFRAITLSILAALLYANNLWLLPKYLLRKKHKTYFALIFSFSYLAGLSYAVLFAFLDKHFPKISLTDVSVFSTFRVVAPVWWIVFIEAISWVVTFSVILLLFSMSWYMRDYSKQRRIVEEVQKKQLETELVFLRNQLNPHFLFNTLNNLYTMTLKKSDNAPVIISKLSNILRFLLYESNLSMIDFDKEKTIMQDYIDLELLRLPNSGSLTFNITSDGPYSIPPLLWLPVLENIFKHGTRYISDSYFLEYSFAIERDVITITSRNVYKKMVSDDTEKKGGIGLVNLKKRLALLYPDKHKISIEAGQEYFLTSIKIELN